MARQTGELALSIGTSKAFESIFNRSASPEQRKKVDAATKMMINVGTLFRNCLESHQKDTSYTARDLAAIVGQEIELIDDLCKRQTRKKIAPLYYYALTQKFAKRYPYAKWRERDTERQRNRVVLEEETIQYIVKENDVKYGEYQDLSFNYDRYDSGIIITHLPHELLRFTDFPELSLVESHTGAFKNRSAWYTKLSDGKSINPIPFCLLTLAAFGDSQTFKPQPEAKSVILNIAKDSNWRGDTTPKQVKDSVGRYRVKPGESKALVVKLLNME